MTTYAGARKRVTIALEDASGAAADGTIAGSLMAPSGSVTALSITDDTGTGAYHSDFTVDQEGRWFVRVTSSGAVVAAAETYIDVAESVFV